MAKRIPKDSESLLFEVKDFYSRGNVTTEEVPLEFIRFALYHLEAAEQLNLLILEDKWTPNYYRGQSVLHLVFHSVELFLKGFILKLAPNTKVQGHSLAKLTKTLRGLAPDIEFEPPFKVKALVPYPELMLRAEKQEKQYHEELRYPINKDGKPWPGTRAFSVASCDRLLKKVRLDTERIYVQLFEKNDKDVI